MAGKYKAVGDDKSAPASDKWYDQPLCFTISYKNWLLLFIAVIILYICLAFTYVGFLEAATVIRQREYLAMPDRFFGDFYKRHVQTHVGATARNIEWKVYNLPEDCEVLSTDNTQTQVGTLACTGGNWRLFPWRVLVDPLNPTSRDTNCGVRDYARTVIDQFPVPAAGARGTDTCDNNGIRAITVEQDSDFIKLGEL
ncbi:unnamed protein product [Pedinophyceae sp. YPF-701]|nr:unnamed protein product [Pedinophyceae sp. YPF-701]